MSNDYGKLMVFVLRNNATVGAIEINNAGMITNMGNDELIAAATLLAMKTESFVRDNPEKAQEAPPADPSAN